MSETVAELKVCFIRMEQLAEDGVISGDKFFALLEVFYKHGSMIFWGGQTV